jgi:hypothetical protein
MARSHVSNACGPVNVFKNRSRVLSVGVVARCRASARSVSFIGAGVSPSPRIIVVMPCVIMLTTRLSPKSSSSYDCA